ncbi:MAG: hypothetical protein DLM58_12715 [Pseudonocardiales bacterium]|nr:MAG: hypothetical protein DLM58_12715 [Pseudonocardiales bacterium]
MQCDDQFPCGRGCQGGAISNPLGASGSTPSRLSTLAPLEGPPPIYDMVAVVMATAEAKALA